MALGLRRANSINYEERYGMEKKVVVIKGLSEECQDDVYKEDLKAVIVDKEYDLLYTESGEEHFIDEKGRNHYLEIYEHEIKQVSI